MNEFIVTSGHNKKAIVLTGENKVTINGNVFNYELTILNKDTYLIRLNNKVYQLTADRINNDTFSVFVDGNMFDMTVRSVIQEKAMLQLESATAGRSKITAVKAPMPGMILKIKKKEGDLVIPGESVIILEAMKMENDIHSPIGGTISSILVRGGSAVEKGALLFTVE